VKELRPLPLKTIAKVRNDLEHADFWTTRRDDEVAHDLADKALLNLAEAVGIDEGGRTVIQGLLLVARGTTQGDYDGAHDGKRIIVEPGRRVAG
jgi:hypothetical protein